MASNSWPTANPSLSAAPLASTDEPGRQPPQPARRSEADPETRSPRDTRFTAWSRSGPFAGHHRLLARRAAHPHDGGESPGITPASPLLRTRLTPRSASVRLSPPGYSSPTRPGRSERPGHRGPPATRTRRARRRHLGTLGTLRGLPESSRWRCRRMPAEPPAGVSSTTAVPPTWTSPRLPRMCGESPPQTAFHGSLHVQACDFASVPFRLQVTPDALNISYRTSTAKAREGLPPPRQRNCQAYTQQRAPGRTGGPRVELRVLRGDQPVVLGAANTAGATAAAGWTAGAATAKVFVTVIVL